MCKATGTPNASVLLRALFGATPQNKQQQTHNNKQLLGFPFRCPLNKTQAAQPQKRFDPTRISGWRAFRRLRPCRRPGPRSWTPASTPGAQVFERPSATIGDPSLIAALGGIGGDRFGGGVVGAKRGGGVRPFFWGLWWGGGRQFFGGVVGGRLV